MLSRVADTIYWMARNIERAENVARFIDVNLHLSLDLDNPSAEQWEPLVQITGDHNFFLERYGSVDRENVIQFLTFDRNYANSIISCVYKARENARSIREYISSEVWEQINTFYLKMKDIAAIYQALETPHDFYSEVKMQSHLNVGVMNNTMSHNEGWHFGRMGRLIERADMTTRLIDVKYFLLLPSVIDVGTSYDTIQWAAVLKSASAFEMYRKQYHRITPDKVVEFLLLSRLFPRATHFCLIKADESLHAITGTPAGTFKNRAEQSLGALRSELAYAEVNIIIANGLHEFLDSLQNKLNNVGDNIFDNFISLRPVQTTQINQ